MVVNHHYFVHTIYLFTPIEPWFVGVIILGLMDLNESPIDEPNTNLELGNMHTKCSPLLHNMTPNFMA